MAVPAVSVLMPVFNAERYVGEAIESILCQSFADFEVVVIDDGSTDDSPNILAGLAARDSRLRVLRQGNSGVVAALNRGLKDCRAPLVARMDADDVAHPERLEQQLAFMKANPEIGRAHV